MMFRAVSKMIRYAGSRNLEFPGITHKKFSARSLAPISSRRVVCHAKLPRGVDLRRGFSSHKWGYVDPFTEEANAKSARLPTALLHEAGKKQINRVEKAMRGMESENEHFKVRREGSEVFVDLAPEFGTYWVQYDKDLRQICFLSPRSGAYCYNYDETTGRWIGEADRHDFEGMLTRDIIQQAYGIPNFDAA